jgi:hypothetical protein
MTKFSDQLYADLMHEHAERLRRTELPAATRGHLTGKRAAWMAGGVGTVAVGITASLAAFGGSGSAAYAVTPHPDGTVTVGISKVSGITGANTTLTSLGDRVVIVPVKAGCPSWDSLPPPAVQAGETKLHVMGSVGVAKDGTVTVDAHGIPQGDLMVLAVDDTGHGISIGARLTSGPAPSCVSMPAGIPGPGGASSGSRQGGGQGSFSYSGSTGGSGTGKAASGAGPVRGSSAG